MISARIEGTPETERIYFRAGDAAACEYYLDMRKNDKDPAVFWAVLPLVSPETNFISYQIRASKAGGPDFVSPWTTVAVTASCTPNPLTAEERSAASNIVLGLTSPKQPAVPCGFRCDGMTWYISSTNVLTRNEACRAMLAGKPWYRNPEAIVLGAGALIGGAVLEGKRPSNPPSPARP
ncbi:MAG TPA: hypothetical protein VNN08_10000 [Thermoanaerobaculia bacterium]|nr:hypothetical protein [Thermoanaerobaculia bacterium]